MSEFFSSITRESYISLVVFNLVPTIPLFDFFQRQKVMWLKLLNTVSLVWWVVVDLSKFLFQIHIFIGVYWLLFTNVMVRLNNFGSFSFFSFLNYLGCPMTTPSNSLHRHYFLFIMSVKCEVLSYFHSHTSMVKMTSGISRSFAFTLQIFQISEDTSGAEQSITKSISLLKWP